MRDGYPAPAPAVPPGSGPLNAARSAVLVYSNSDAAQLAFLCGRDTGGTPWAAGTTDYRYSVTALPIYLVGALGTIPGGPATPLDGVDGPGFLQPKRDGTFEKSGRRFDPFFDVTKNAKALVAVDASLGRYELRDPYGTPYRYYRWVRGYFNAGQYVDQLIDPVSPSTPALNIPEAVVSGPNSANTPIADRVKELTEARDADYAVVGAGPNQLFGDEPIAAIAAKLGVAVPTVQDEIDRLRDRAREDNLVELGR